MARDPNTGTSSSCCHKMLNGKACHSESLCQKVTNQIKKERFYNYVFYDNILEQKYGRLVFCFEQDLSFWHMDSLASKPLGSR